MSDHRNSLKFTKLTTVSAESVVNNAKLSASIHLPLHQGVSVADLFPAGVRARLLTTSKHVAR